MITLLLVLLGALVTAVLTLVLHRSAPRSGHIDQPQQRSSHLVPTPTGGGLAIFMGLLLLVALPPIREMLPPGFIEVIVPAAFALSLLGWLDDRNGIAARWRLLLQILCACAFLTWCLFSAMQPASALGLPESLLWALLPGLLLLMVWTMNAFNFMDGSNGMAVFEAMFVALMLALLFALDGQLDLALAAALLAGACAGFAPWNFPSGRYFMGDAGSVPLGFTLISLIFLGVFRESISLAVGLLLLLTFYLDAGLTLLVRLFRGERWYTAHKTHAYQRMIGQGWSHSKVLVLYQAINLLVIAPLVLIAVQSGVWAWLLLLGTAVLFSIVWFVLFPRMGGNHSEREQTQQNR